MTSIQRQEFRLSYDDEPGRAIRGRVFVPPAPPVSRDRPGVIVLHGFKGFMDWGFFPELGRSLAEAGLFAVTFNMSGSGVGEHPLEMDDDEAFRRNTPSRELEDLGRVRAWVESGAVPGLDPGRLGLVGHSLGGGVSLLAAERNGGYRAVVTWSAISHPDRYDAETARLWRERGVLDVPNARTGQVHPLGLGWLEDVEHNRDALDILAACRRTRTPTLLIHGTEDEAVAFAEARALEAALDPAVGRLVPIEGAGHTFGARHPFEGTPAHLAEVLARTRAFLGEHLM